MKYVKTYEELDLPFFRNVDKEIKKLKSSIESSTISKYIDTIKILSTGYAGVYGRQNSMLGPLSNYHEY